MELGILEQLTAWQELGAFGGVMALLSGALFWQQRAMFRFMREQLEAERRENDRQIQSIDNLAKKIDAHTAALERKVHRHQYTDQPHKA
jgi:hypothetical protein